MASSDHPDSSRKSAPATGGLPVDEAWLLAQRRGIPADFDAFHGPNFTLLTNLPDEVAKVQLQALESAFEAFYTELPKLGVTPARPGERLVTVLFKRRDHFRAFHRQAEGADVPWGTGHYSQRSNRITLYHDLDNPAFAEIRKGIRELEEKIVELQHEIANPPPEADEIDLKELRAKLARANEDWADRMGRLDRVASDTTAAKVRHEAAHQLFYNSGLMTRGRDYPFWLSEGLAMLFEPADAQGRVAMGTNNPLRLPTYKAARQRGTLMALDKLLTYAPADEDDPREVTGAYAQAWALMEYLRQEKPEVLERLIEAAAKPPADWPMLFRQQAGPDLTALDAELNRFFK